MAIFKNHQKFGAN